MKNPSNVLSLNGTWGYLTDSDNQFNYKQVIKRYETKKLPQMRVPSNWQLEGLNNFSGAVWFVKMFNLRNSSLGLFILEFNGVDYFTNVWLNENFLGAHEGYFQKFYFDASNHVNKGDENLLVVKVISPKEEPRKVWPFKKKLIKGIFNHHDCRPGGWSYEHGQDQNTGGIWNDVNLIQAENIYIENLKIESKLLNDYKTARIKISCNYYTNINLPQKDTVEIKIETPRGKIINYKSDVVLTKVNSKFDIAVKFDNPDLWWTWDLGKQSLYRLTLMGKFIPETKITFGIREVKSDDRQSARGGFYLNGKKLFLRGTNIIPTQFLSDLSQEKITRQVKWLKEANVNIVRMHAHVNRKEYYDECDKQGILVWQDFALQWTYNESPEFISNSSSQIKDMVKLYYNHPSIVFWCCHNEPGNQIETLDLFLCDSVLSVDNSRIVRLASNYEEHPYDGWYWGNKEHFASRPMGPLVTEFGAQAVPGIDSLNKFMTLKQINQPDWSKWAYHNFQYEQTFHIADINRGKNIKEFINNSQNYQAELIRTAIDFYRCGKNKDITGVFQFMFIDCWPSITWSVVDYYGKKKKGYFALQTAFQPLYISIGVRQKKYFHSKTLHIDFWIINDYQKVFSDCIIYFRIGKNVIGKINMDRIGKDSIEHYNWERIKNVFTPLPGNLRGGKHLVKVELRKRNSKEVLSYNDFEIEVIASLKERI
jgi:beta-mannosidase